MIYSTSCKYLSLQLSHYCQVLYNRRVEDPRSTSCHATHSTSTRETGRQTLTKNFRHCMYGIRYSNCLLPIGDSLSRAPSSGSTTMTSVGHFFHSGPALLEVTINLALYAPRYVENTVDVPVSRIIGTPLEGFLLIT